MMRSRDSSLTLANSAFRRAEYATAAREYLKAARKLDKGSAALIPHIEDNMELLRGRRMRDRREAWGRGEPAHVAVCGWSLAHNPAGRVLTLADAYRRVVPNVEVIGALFPRWGGALWPPMHGIDLRIHAIPVKSHAGFVAQALGLVMARPYDVVHLSKPRFPNLVLGLLYELVWGARIFWDIDDEELGFVDAVKPLPLSAALDAKGVPVSLDSMYDSFSTRIAVGQARRFDAITVSNPALQARYGGSLIPHVRDEAAFVSVQSARIMMRSRWRIPNDAKVVLFFGTPRKHKGLLATAHAIAALGREDIWFVIVGDFPSSSLKRELQAVPGVRVRFVGDQPYRSIPDVVAGGDYTVLLQEAGSLVSQYQLPAKLVDALAGGLVVFAQVTRATAWLQEAGALIAVTPETLTAALRTQMAVTDDSMQRAHNRAVFLERLSIKAYEDVLTGLLQAESTKPRPSWRGRLAHLAAGRLPALW